MKNDRLAKIASQNEKIVLYDHGYWLDGRLVDLSRRLIYPALETRTYKNPKFFREYDEKNFIHSQYTKIKVTNEDSVSAAYKIVKTTGFIPLILNFASAKRPGGGYINGSKAQEEDLCRCSSLYYMIKNQSLFYNQYKKDNNYYSDALIYSPKVVFFRDEKYDCLERPFAAHVITCAAPNNCNNNLKPKKLRKIFKRRINNILSLAAYNEVDELVLGAWGCGVFNNDPQMVAEIFRDLLRSNRFKNAFEIVHFAVLDKTKEQKIFETFKNVLEEK